MFSGDLWRSQLIKKKEKLTTLPEVRDLTYVHAAVHFSEYSVFVWSR